MKTLGTLLACALLVCSSALAAPAKQKVTLMKQWTGKGLEEVLKAYPGTPSLNDEYPAINAVSELRAAVASTYPAAGPASHAVRIRELWWPQGDYILTFLLHFKEGKWVVLGATKWHKDVVF